MTKYKQYIEKMLEANKELFDDFKRLHSAYALDEDKYQDEFNREGERILAVAKTWEGKLCSQSEKAGFGSYTGTLAEKFQEELRKLFPLIDHVGVIVSPFTLKKIKF